GAKALGYTVKTTGYFDTITLEGGELSKVREAMGTRSINLRYSSGACSISLDETVRATDVRDVLAALAEAMGRQAIAPGTNGSSSGIPAALQRKSDFLAHPVFNTHHTETELMR